MVATPTNVNLSGKAPLANVGLTLGALSGAMKRPAHLPGIVVLYGLPAWAKSTAATVATVQLQAYYDAGQVLMDAQGRVPVHPQGQGFVPAKTIYEMEEQVAGQLAASRRR